MAKNKKTKIKTIENNNGDKKLQIDIKKELDDSKKIKPKEIFEMGKKKDKKKLMINKK